MGIQGLQRKNQISIYETENVKIQRPAMKSTKNTHASHSLPLFDTPWAFQKDHAQDKVYIAIFTSGEARRLAKSSYHYCFPWKHLKILGCNKL